MELEALNLPNFDAFQTDKQIDAGIWKFSHWQTDRDINLNCSSIFEWGDSCQKWAGHFDKLLTWSWICLIVRRLGVFPVNEE